MTPDPSKLARLLSKSDTSVSDVLEVCPFRTFVGPGSFAEFGAEAWEACAGGVFAMLELEPLAPWQKSRRISWQTGPC
jgi:hypothetical protein